MNEFEIQRALDLPAPLPEDETLLWIGSPTVGGIARNVFHLGTLAAYFAAVIGAHFLWVAADGATLGEAGQSAARLAPLGLGALAMFALLAFMIARSTTYAFTDRRVIMRIGVALSITLTIPFRAIARADLRVFRNGCGDLPLSLAGTDRMAYLHLWPHARPWRLKDTVPMLLSVPDATAVGRRLGEALAAHMQSLRVSAARVEVAQSAQTAPGETPCQSQPLAVA